MAVKPTKGKGGRPPKSEAGALTRTLAFRLRPLLHEKLQNAALLNGRSMSEEVEARVTCSVQHEAALAEMFGSPQHQDFLLAIGSATRLADAMSDGSEDAARQVHAAVISLVEGLAGKKARFVLEEAATTGHSGERAAERVLLLRAGLLQPEKSIADILGR